MWLNWFRCRLTGEHPWQPCPWLLGHILSYAETDSQEGVVAQLPKTRGRSRPFACTRYFHVWHIRKFMERRRRPKILVFLSSGGTCRDPIAKAITTKLFETHKPEFPFVIRAAGLGPISKNEASYAARSVIREMYGQDLLADHKPELLTEKLAEEADLILAMDQFLLEPRKTSPKGWPDAYKGKVYPLKKFFGLEGNISDPWPDGKDEITLQRYKDCASELKQILDQHFQQLVNALHM